MWRGCGRLACGSCAAFCRRDLCCGGGGILERGGGGGREKGGGGLSLFWLVVVNCLIDERFKGFGKWERERVVVSKN